MKNYFLLLILAITALLSSACSNPSMSTLLTPPMPPTPDPCAAANLPFSVKKINDLQREFDDASQLASNVTRDQLPASISNLQRIRREAQDQTAPGCLSVLKLHQLNHMNIVIDTFIAFLGGTDQNALNDGITRARQEHNLYTLELSRLLGTPTPAVTDTPVK